MKGRVLLPAALAVALPCAAAPPQISGGPYLSDAVGENLQTVLTFETTGPMIVTLFDPDPGETLGYRIVVEGPLGGVIGGAEEGVAATGVPVDLPVRFISGVVSGASHLRIDASDGVSSITRYINFEVVPHPSPPAGEMFRVSQIDPGWPYHFNVLVTDPAEIQKGLDIVAGVIPQQIVAGNVVKGDAGFNVNLQDPEQPSWSWYLDPATVHFAEAFIEVCDGLSCLVEADLGYWVNQIGFYCPWSTVLLPHNPVPPSDPLRITLDPGEPTVVRWDAVPGAGAYDVIRGDLASLDRMDCSIPLDPVICLAEDTPLTSAPPDAALPAPGTGFFYLARYVSASGAVGWGPASSVFLREAASGCAP